jgi:hypothetical protein
MFHFDWTLLSFIKNCQLDEGGKTQAKNKGTKCEILPNFKRWAKHLQENYKT